MTEEWIDIKKEIYNFGGKGNLPNLKLDKIK